MKTLRLLAVFLIIAVLSAACAPRRAKNADGKLDVCVSFFVMADFAAKIGGDRVTITTLTPNGTEPHEWEPTPNDMIAIENADVFLYHGGIEFWAEDVLKAINKENLRVDAVFWDAKISLSLDDPHAWLSPKVAKEELMAVEDAFRAADPANADYYIANYYAWAKKFDDLDEACKAVTANAASPYVVVSHAAFGWLCDDYGLTQIALEGAAADSEPSAGRLAEVIDFVKEHKITTVFSVEMEPSKAIEQVAEATGAKVAVLSPLEGLTAAQAENGADYISVMYENLEALKSALR